ncbi:tryptophan halogenase family protein [Thalassotalea agarivorans]|uniref:Tryptophan halogenase n=1 Tax=Thalassotalea agarivorans TaxID=349064 RepID=A0A1H9YA93_THASX|nr:tryptophan halogenase family protein [Thalassotalea agarivorans]SES65870.1 tryptophan halogenase [Thalassotalea agarivorans]
MSKVNSINRIVIMGGGTAGWMTAAALSKLLPKTHYTVTLVESEQIGTVGVGEATLPHLRFFNQRLGIDEKAFMRATNATFKLGIEFSHWAQIGDAYIHPFGDYGEGHNGVDFYQYWLAEGIADIHDLDNFSLPVALCNAKKFAFPSDDLSNISSTYSYAYHIDAGLYATFLRQFSEQHGARRIEGKVVDVKRRALSGNIESLILENGAVIEGDLFIDCSGFSSILLQKVLGVAFEDWSEFLPCNRAVAVATKAVDSNVLPYTKAMARDAGWQWNIPLQNRQGNGYVYCDKFISETQAIDTLQQHLNGEQINDINSLSFTAGKTKCAWKNNVVAVGLSSGFLEPLESTSIYLIQSSIMKLIEFLPQSQNINQCRTEFNRFMGMEMDRIRDFLILHYCATEREDSEFWRYVKHMQLPDSLGQKMAMYKSTGYIEKYQYGLFLTPSWQAVYHGQRVRPNQIDTRTTQLSDADRKALLQHYKEQVLRCVDGAHEHSQVLQKFLGSSQQSPAPATFSLYGARRA